MNHFPSTGLITRKEELSRLFKMMKCIHGAAYNFFPISFCVPNEYKKFLRLYQQEADMGIKVHVSLCPILTDLVYMDFETGRFE